MTLADFFTVIGAPAAHPGAALSAIKAAETRLGGRFPETLRAWFQEADGFDGEAKMCMWRFHSLHQLRRLSEFLPAFTEFSIKLHNHPDRRAEGQHHIMVCDALIWLPFYLVNICPESPYFSEVVYADADKGSQNEAQFVAATFDEFADLLMANPEEAFLSPDLSS